MEESRERCDGLVDGFTIIFYRNLGRGVTVPRTRVHGFPTVVGAGRAASGNEEGWRSRKVARGLEEAGWKGVIRMVRKRWRGVAPYFYTVWPLLCIIPHLARSSRDADSLCRSPLCSLKTRTYRAFRRFSE